MSRRFADDLEFNVFYLVAYLTLGAGIGVTIFALTYWFAALVPLYVVGGWSVWRMR